VSLTADSKQEIIMAKGQIRSNKEAKKPKKEAPPKPKPGAAPGLSKPAKAPATR
jgi:hypothetical protein